MQNASDIYEKLGAFYLGKEYDLDSRKLLDEFVLYDSKDLVTHAVIVGMTGSGKTGLGIGLLEEAAIDGIPAIIVDPKGDLSNLLLQFPELRAADFAPWIHADDANRQGMSAEEYARAEAEKWERGLESWDQDRARIARLAQSAEFTIYTPGSDAGTPVSILSSFAAPPASVREDGDLLRDRIASTATGLLTLLGVEADPLRSREHILLTNILHHAWGKGQDLQLGSIIQMVQSPPFNQIGVMDLDSFFPAKDRFELAMTLNNLLAAPGFSAWLQGEPLNIDQLLHSPSGKPRHAIFSIAHLSDSERMFFVSLLLNQTLSWMRSRPGTTSLRALLYIDEVFGYFPPVKEPPSKKPLLTLLKQARAFGLGVVLATQNPVDLDYKGLANMGTWFLGRLQTERDKERMLDGLEGASNEAGDAFDRQSMSELLARLGQRVFLMHNVHEDRPVVFQTRWALSYLAGPMTRNQIRKLTASRSRAAEVSGGDAFAERVTRTADVADVAEIGSARPILPPEVPQLFLPIQKAKGAGTLLYEPHVLGIAR
ncbi:MAG: ATP-binding protein, partial [Planctomycetales bacterium]|nr:ATP-binding protein [Planctomycetales bacterium]